MFTAAIQIAASTIGVIVLLIGGMLAYIIRRLGHLEEKIDSVRQDVSTMSRFASLISKADSKNAERGGLRVNALPGILFVWTNHASLAGVRPLFSTM